MADYGKTKNVKVSAETRGAGTPEQVQQLGMKTWQYMVGIIKDAGAASNVDIGNVAAANQQELHDCIKAWFPYSSGNMHIKSSPNWNIGAGRQVHRKPGVQRALLDRGGHAPGGADRLQHDPGEPVSGRSGWDSAAAQK